MALTIPPIKSAPSGPPVEAGTHHAILYGVVDLGHQHGTDFEGQPNVQHKVLLLFELPEERIEDGRPRGMSKEVTLSMHEKATLRHATHALMGRQLSDEEALKVQLADLIGKNCLLAVVQKPRKDGQGNYAMVDKFAPLMKGMKPREPENNFTFYEIEPGPLPADLPQWVKDKIDKAEERTGGPAAPGKVYRPGPPTPRRPPMTTEEVLAEDAEAERIPF